MTSYKDRSFSPIATYIQDELLCHISIKATKDDSEGGKRSRLTIKGRQAEVAWKHFVRETNKLALQGKLKDPGPVPWYKCPPAERIVEEDDENRRGAGGHAARVKLRIFLFTLIMILLYSLFTE